MGVMISRYFLFSYISYKQIQGQQQYRKFEMKFSNPFLNRTFHTVFYSVLYIFTSPLLQLLLYQVIKFRHPWYNLGLFHLLIVLYFPSMVVSLALICSMICQKYDTFQRSPFFLTFGQLFSLAALTALQICCDYIALTLNTSLDIQTQSTNTSSLGSESFILWDLVRFLSIQLVMQIILTPFFNKWLLRNKIKDRALYIRTVIFAIVLYLFQEFITFDQASTVVNQLDKDAVKIDLEYFQITIPRAFYYFSTVAQLQNPSNYMQEVIPLLLTLASSVFGIWRRVLSMRYTLKQGYIRKMKLWVREKIKIIDEAEINLSMVDRSGNLFPRKVSRNAHIIKRHKAIYEGNARKKVIAKSQLKQGQQEVEDELLVPYKKVSFLPAYFYKVFIKKKKEIQKPGKKGAKPEPPKKKEKEDAKENGDMVSLKTKKLMNQFKQDQEDYKQEMKLKIEKLHKTIQKQTRIGSAFAKYNLKKKHFVDSIQSLKEKNNQLRKYDELEGMLNSYEQTLFHQHLFTDAEESHLTKLDLYYANQHYVYNEGLISADLKKTITIQYVIEHLVMTPFCLILDRLLNIDGHMFLELYEDHKSVLNANITYYFFLPFIFAILMLLRPIAQYTYTFHISTETQRWLSLFIYLATFFGYFLFLETASFVDLKIFIPFLGLVYMVLYTQESLEKQWEEKQNTQIVQLLKDQIFGFDFDSAKKFQNQVNLIYSELGTEAFYQAIEDCMLSNNPKAVNHLAPSIMPLRKRFDPNYFKITSEWAGGYPRPMVEVSESLWDFSDAAKMIQGPKAKEIIAQNSRLTRPDIDLADLMYFKEIEWENEYGKILAETKKFKRVADNLDLARRKSNRDLANIEAIRKLQEEEEENQRKKEMAALRRQETKKFKEEQRKLQEEQEALLRQQEEETLRKQQEEAQRQAEEEAKAQMEPILRFDSVMDEEKQYLRQKENELARLLEEKEEMEKHHMELIEQQRQELEYQKWQAQFEKEYAVRQYQQMLEEHEREMQRQKEEEEKRRLDEELQMNQIAEFAQNLEQLYEIKEVEEEHEHEHEQEQEQEREDEEEAARKREDYEVMIVEDIIDDCALEALDLHDSDESGDDLKHSGLELDQLEEDAIPEEPLQQQNNIMNFEFIGQPPPPPMSLGDLEKLREQHTKALTDLLKNQQRKDGNDSLMSMYQVKGKSGSRLSQLQQDASPNHTTNLKDSIQEINQSKEAAEDEVEEEVADLEEVEADAIDLGDTMTNVLPEPHQEQPNHAHPHPEKVKIHLEEEEPFQEEEILETPMMDQFVEDAKKKVHEEAADEGIKRYEGKNKELDLNDDAELEQQDQQKESSLFINEQDLVPPQQNSQPNEDIAAQEDVLKFEEVQPYKDETKIQEAENEKKEETSFKLSEDKAEGQAKTQQMLHISQPTLIKEQSEIPESIYIDDNSYIEVDYVSENPFSPGRDTIRSKAAKSAKSKKSKKPATKGGVGSIVDEYDDDFEMISTVRPTARPGQSNNEFKFQPKEVIDEVQSMQQQPSLEEVEIKQMGLTAKEERVLNKYKTGLTYASQNTKSKQDVTSEQQLPQKSLHHPDQAEIHAQNNETPLDILSNKSLKEIIHFEPNKDLAPKIQVQDNPEPEHQLVHNEKEHPNEQQHQPSSLHASIAEKPKEHAPITVKESHTDHKQEIVSPSHNHDDSHKVEQEPQQHNHEQTPKLQHENEQHINDKPHMMEQEQQHHSHEQSHTIEPAHEVAKEKDATISQESKLNLVHSVKSIKESLQEHELKESHQHHEEQKNVSHDHFSPIKSIVDEGNKSFLIADNYDDENIQLRSPQPQPQIHASQKRSDLKSSEAHLEKKSEHVSPDNEEQKPENAGEEELQEAELDLDDILEEENKGEQELIETDQTKEIEHHNEVEEEPQKQEAADDIHREAANDNNHKSNDYNPREYFAEHNNREEAASYQPVENVAPSEHQTPQIEQEAVIDDDYGQTNFGQTQNVPQNQFEEENFDDWL